MKKYLLFNEENEVVTLKKGDVVYCENSESGISGVAKVASADHQNGFIYLEIGVTSTGRVFKNAYVPFSDYVGDATEEEIYRLVNAVDAIEEDDKDEKESTDKLVESASRVVDSYFSLQQEIKEHVEKFGCDNAFGKIEFNCCK